MMRRLMGALASRPLVYEIIAFLLGGRVSETRLRKQAERIVGASSPSLIVIDVGAGTGRLRRIWPRTARYFCLDVEEPKLTYFLRNVGGGLAVMGDAGQLPFPDHSVDVVICVAVSHHLDDALFERFVAEARRVLKASGEMVYFDAVRRTDRWQSRLLWHYDRGSFPRPVERIEAVLARHLVPQHREQYIWGHEFVLWTGQPRIAVPCAEQSTATET